MRSMTGDRSSSPADIPMSPRAADVIPRADRGRLLIRLAAACIGISILVMILASLLRSSWMYPPVVMPAVGPPWDVQSVHVSATVATTALWVATLLGAAGLVAGLAAVRRGARFNLRVLLITAALAVAALTVMLPAGSTDAFDYASYGRIAALGHSPYVWAPYALRLAHNQFTESVPIPWQHSVSIYGPLATVEQFLAAKLGGFSAARIVFWLKLWNSIAFGVVALVIDRLLRHDPAQRLRAHLLWTVNPLLLWYLVAAGHIDTLAVGAGLLAIVVLGEHSGTCQPPMLRVLAAGALAGAAADIKINYVLFGLGLAWALRRSYLAQLAAGAAALVVLVPGYVWFGRHAVKALVLEHNLTSADSFFRLSVFSPLLRHVMVFGIVLVAAIAVLALWRLPAGAVTRPAIRPTLALIAAWLFFGPYQLPWYDAMIICLLVLYPASRLDWLVVARLTAGSLPNIWGDANAPAGSVNTVHHVLVVWVAPLILLCCAIGLVVLCVSGWWNVREPYEPPSAAPPEPAGLVPSAAG